METMESEAIQIVRREWDDFVRFSINSDNWTTGPGWLDYFHKNGTNLKGSAEKILLSDFPTTERAIINIVVLKGELFGNDFTTQGVVDVSNEIWGEISKRYGVKSTILKMTGIQNSCLIRKQLSDSDLELMGLDWLIIVHEPVNVGDGPVLFGISRLNIGNILSTIDGNPDYNNWAGKGAFAFEEEV